MKFLNIIEFYSFHLYLDKLNIFYTVSKPPNKQQQKMLAVDQTTNSASMPEWMKEEVKTGVSFQLDQKII